MGNNGQCVKGNNCTFRHDMNKRELTPQKQELQEKVNCMSDSREFQGV